MTNPIVDLKSILLKTTQADRSDSNLEAQDFEVNAVQRMVVENKKAAKIWMAATKFVGPAVGASWSISGDLAKADRVATAILESSASSAFASVVDAYSAGAPFDKNNIFGLYRYSLANASSCTARLAITHKCVLGEFGKLLTSHLCEVATGVKPVSRRHIPERQISATVSSSYRDNLNSYLRADYPDTRVTNSTLIQVSIVNALARCLSNYMVRARVKPHHGSMKTLLEATVVDNLELWIDTTERASNGNILSGVDDRTRTMVIQNALNLIVIVSSAAFDRVTQQGVSLSYHFDAIKQIESISEELLVSIMRRTNAYAASFANNEYKVFESVEESLLPFTRASNIDGLTPSAWLSLFELPTKVSKYLTLEIASNETISFSNLTGIVDTILHEALLKGMELQSELGLQDKWVTKALCNEFIEYAGSNSIRGIDTITLNSKHLADVIAAVTDKCIDKGFSTLFNKVDVPAVSALSVLKVGLSTSAIKLATLTTGLKDSRQMLKFVAVVTAKIALNSMEMQRAMYLPQSNVDSCVMQFGAILNAVSQLTIDCLRHELFNNPSSTNDSLISDYLNDKALAKRIDGSVTAYSKMLGEITEHAHHRINQMALLGDESKKPEAAPDKERLIGAALAL